MKVDVPKDKFNNLTNRERKTLYDLKSDKNIVIKIADRGSAVAVQYSGNYIKKEAEKQLGDEEVYEEVSIDAALLLKTINAVIAKIKNGVI